MKVKQLLTGGSSKKNKSSDGTTSTSSLFASSGTLKSDKIRDQRRHQSPSPLDELPPRSRFSESRTETTVFVEPQVSYVAGTRGKRVSWPDRQIELLSRYAYHTIRIQMVWSLDDGGGC